MLKIKTRQKKALAALLILILFSSGMALQQNASAAVEESSESATDPALETDDMAEAVTETERTTTVTRGTLLASAQAKASANYPVWESIVFTSEYGSASFVRFLVETGDTVAVGDPIAEISATVDEITLAELELRIQRATENYEAFMAQYEERLEASEERVRTSTGTDREQALLARERTRMELERSHAVQEANVAQLTEQMEIYTTAMETTQILAETAGVIGWLGRYRSGDTIWNGSTIGGMYQTDTVLFTVTDTSGVLHYGTSVTLKNNQGDSYAARITSCADASLSDSMKTGLAYIQPLEEIPLEKRDGLTAYYDTIVMEHVLLVDTSAIKSDSGGYYVMEQKDGTLSKRYFLIGRSINGTCYALDGLSEGMTVVIR